MASRMPWMLLSMKSLKSLNFDTTLRIAVMTILFGFLLLNGSVLEVQYPHNVVELYDFPWWRFILVALVIAATSWCPFVGMATAVAVFFYLNDMFLLTARSFRNQSS